MDEVKKKFACKDERASPRYGYEAKATVRRRTLPDEAGVILDLSMTGCLVGFSEPIHCSLEEEAEVHLRSTYLSFRALGSIRRCGGEGREVGFLFDTLTSRSRDDLRTLIEDLERKTLELKT